MDAVVLPTNTPAMPNNQFQASADTGASAGSFELIMQMMTGSATDGSSAGPGQGAASEASSDGQPSGVNTRDKAKQEGDRQDSSILGNLCLPALLSGVQSFQLQAAGSTSDTTADLALQPESEQAAAISLYQPDTPAAGTAIPDPAGRLDLNGQKTPAGPFLQTLELTPALQAQAAAEVVSEPTQGGDAQELPKSTAAVGTGLTGAKATVTAVGTGTVSGAATNGIAADLAGIAARQLDADYESAQSQNPDSANLSLPVKTADKAQSSQDAAIGPSPGQPQLQKAAAASTAESVMTATKRQADQTEFKPSREDGKDNLFQPYPAQINQKKADQPLLNPAPGQFRQDAAAVQSQAAQQQGSGTPEAAAAGHQTGQLLGQIVEKAHLLVGEGSSSINIHLKPDFLGDLKLIVTTERGVVSAQFLAQNQATAHLIESRLPELRQALNDQGISWQQLSVGYDSGQGGYRQGGFQQPQGNGQQAWHPDWFTGNSQMAADEPAITGTGSLQTGNLNYLI